MKLSVLLAYVRSIGVHITVLIVLLYIAASASSVGSHVWLSQWSDDVHDLNATDYIQQRNLRLGVYGALAFVQGNL